MTHPHGLSLLPASVIMKPTCEGLHPDVLAQGHQARKPWKNSGVTELFAQDLGSEAGPSRHRDWLCGNVRKPARMTHAVSPEGGSL